MQLSPLERAKLHVTLAFAANTLFTSAPPPGPHTRQTLAGKLSCPS